MSKLSNEEVFSESDAVGLIRAMILAKQINFAGSQEDRAMGAQNFDCDADVAERDASYLKRLLWYLTHRTEQP